MRPTTFVLLLVVYFAVLACTDAWWSRGGSGSSSSSRSSSKSKPSWESVKQKAKETWSSAKDTAKEAWNYAKDKAKETYHKVNDWAKENPAAVAVGGAVLGAALAGRKREAELSEETVLQALNDACPNFQLPADATYDAVIEGYFESADKNNDHVLDKDELQEFAAFSTVIQYCAEFANSL